MHVKKIVQIIAVLSLTFGNLAYLEAGLVLNSPQAISLRVTVQPIIVSNTDGSNTAEYFGSALQQMEIESFVDSIWAQAGIDILFLTPNTWNNSFANVGTSSPRPTSDLDTIVATGDAAMVGNTDASILDMYFVEIAAGFPDLGENTANGLAYVGGNGITQHVGDNLVDFVAGRELIATVVSHEIGHNLGLGHIVEAENLMQSGGAANQGERLNASQITTARKSDFAAAVPEPSGFLMVVLGMCVAGLRRQRTASVS